MLNRLVDIVSRHEMRTVMQDLCQTISRYSGTSRRFVKNSLCATLLFSPVHSLQSDDVGGAQSSCKQCSVYTLSTGQSLIRHYLNIRSPAPTSIYSAANSQHLIFFYTLSIFELKNIPYGQSSAKLHDIRSSNHPVI